MLRASACSVLVSTLTFGPASIVAHAGNPAARASRTARNAAWLAAEAIDVAIERSPIRLRERVFCLVSGSPGLTGRDLMASAKMGEPR